MSSFDSNSDFGARNSRKRDTRMASSRGRNMSSRRKYQSGSGYRSKRKSEFHWGYVAVPAVVGVAGVTTLAIVLSKNKSKPGKDGAKGETGTAGTADTADTAGTAGTADLTLAEARSDPVLMKLMKEKLQTHQYYQMLVAKEYGLIYKQEDGKESKFKYPQNASGRSDAEHRVFTAFLNSNNIKLAPTIGGNANEYINNYEAVQTEMQKDMNQVYVQVIAGYAARTFYGGAKATAVAVATAFDATAVATYDVIDTSWDFVNMTGVVDW
jgi:hypothetical protein